MNDRHIYRFISRFVFNRFLPELPDFSLCLVYKRQANPSGIYSISLHSLHFGFSDRNNIRRVRNFLFLLWHDPEWIPAVQAVATEIFQVRHFAYDWFEIFAAYIFFDKEEWASILWPRAYSSSYGFGVFVYSVKKSVFNIKLLEVKNTSLKGSLVACVRRLLWMIDRLRA